jgi:hypothetical protein
LAAAASSVAMDDGPCAGRIDASAHKGNAAAQKGCLIGDARWVQVTYAIGSAGWRIDHSGDRRAPPRKAAMLRQLGYMPVTLRSLRRDFGISKEGRAHFDPMLDPVWSNIA